MGHESSVPEVLHDNIDHHIHVRCFLASIPVTDSVFQGIRIHESSTRSAKFYLTPKQNNQNQKNDYWKTREHLKILNVLSEHH